VLRLSETVYGNDSIAAIGVAAHEVGHAIQHQQGYKPMEIRQKSFGHQFASTASFPILLIGVVFASADLIMIGITAVLRGSVVYIVTLPVEFNASNRAVLQLSQAWSDQQR
jgi:Zn-dependent membrane protease YugP